MCECGVFGVLYVVYAIISCGIAITGLQMRFFWGRSATWYKVSDWLCYIGIALMTPEAIYGLYRLIFQTGVGGLG